MDENILLPEAQCVTGCTAAATQVEYSVKNINTTGLDEHEPTMQDAFYTTVEDGLLILHKREKTKMTGGQFTLLDLNGREIANTEIMFSANQKAHMLTQIKRGIYVLRATMGDGQTLSQKIKY